MKVKITNPNKIIFPKEKITKKEIVEYYSKISDKILPYLKNRPLALVRYPDGINKEGFYQKNAGNYFPDWIKTKKINGTKYVICNDKDTLLYLANQATIEFHCWLSKVSNQNNPDKIVFDIDPPNSKMLKNIKDASILLRNILKEIGLKSFVLSTGIKGLHVIAPIKNSSFKESKNFAGKIAEILIKKYPEKYTLEQRIEKRGAKIFIDLNRNNKAQLSIAPYSLRAVQNATIAMPLSWNELSKFRHEKYSIKNYANINSNPWRDFFKDAVSLKIAMKKLNKLENGI